MLRVTVDSPQCETEARTLEEAPGAEESVVGEVYATANEAERVPNQHPPAPPVNAADPSEQIRLAELEQAAIEALESGGCG